MDRDDRVLFLKNTLLIVGGVCALVVMLLLRVRPQRGDERRFSREASVNDIQLYGLTFDEAQNAVKDSEKAYFDSINISCTAAGQSFSLSANDFMISSVKDTVSEAYSACESNVPADECVFYTSYKIDTDKLRSILEDLAQKVDVQPVEPTVTFDRETRDFVFTEGANGLKLDVEKSLANIVEKIESENFGSIELNAETDYPKHTVQEIKENTVKIAEFSSVTTNNYNRNKNIDLMCSYVDGVCIAPGEVLSINELVGERTVEKGFLPAPAIMDGKRTVDDIGGGICQLSGTLYNTALLANMKIVERLPHSWPSDYLDIGLDSTLDWNTQKDLKIQNPTEYGVFIVAWLESSDLNSSNVLHVDMYGKPFPKGVTVKVYSEIIETTQPEPTLITYTSRLKPGERRTITQARTGYRARVWREFYCDGELIDTEIVSESVYSPIRGEVQVGKATQSTPIQPSNPTPTPAPTEPNEPTEPPESDDPIVIDPPDDPGPTDPPHEG